MKVVLALFSILSLVSCAPQNQESNVCNSETDKPRESTSKPCYGYLECVDGEWVEQTCVYGLFWNEETLECDVADNVKCELTKEQLLQDFKLERPRTIFLTFENGPNPATKKILEILKENDVPATFFLVGMNADNVTGDWMSGYLEEGHLIGDNSYDHMFHNKPEGVYDGVDSFKDVMVDSSYFGHRSFQPIRKQLVKQGVAVEDVARAEIDFFRYVRLPYTNNFRIRGRLHENCNPEIDNDCSFPASSVQIGNQLADYLHEEWNREIFGFDMQYKVEWEKSPIPHSYGAEGLLMRLMTVRTHIKDKIVIIDHDFIYDRFPEDLERLDRIIKLAKALGYNFATVDQYYSPE